MPAATHIEAPETLLKKRKQNEKAREEKLAAALAARKVSLWSIRITYSHSGCIFYYDAYFFRYGEVLRTLQSIN